MLHRQACHDQVAPCSQTYPCNCFNTTPHLFTPHRWWIPCVTSPGLSRLGGALFTDLPANVLGSWAMGLFASGDILAANYHGSGFGLELAATSHPHLPALAFLPPSSPLQKHKALALGLRTGFCGSLTTFASWILQVGDGAGGGR